MNQEIPKSILEEFIIVTENIKYPTYPDEEFQKSISEEENLNNYSEQNINKSFNDFYVIFQSCKNKV